MLVDVELSTTPACSATSAERVRHQGEQTEGQEVQGERQSRHDRLNDQIGRAHV